MAVRVSCFHPNHVRVTFKKLLLGPEWSYWSVKHPLDNADTEGYIWVNQITSYTS